MQVGATAYRADIDGLRAVAVLTVVLFHARVSGFAGGFVGVDVFFVISGFLITRLILAEIERGTFSVGQFYERRIRRLFPALVFAVLLTLAASLLLDTPSALMGFGRSLTGVVLFASNVVFWRDTGYFAAPAASQPLLHTWSLSVEEQFYIGFPLTLWCIWRFGGRRYTLWLATLAVLSFALCVYVTRTRPSAAFYLAPFRAWELLIGALLSSGALPSRLPSPLRSVLACVGLLLILGSVWAYSPSEAFPGVLALAPTLGAASIIYAGIDGTTPINALLSTRPLVFGGLISYSLYLLHWPFLVFARQAAVDELTPLQVFGTLLLSFIASVCSWRFVEQPFRRGVPERRTRVFVACGVSLVCFAVFAMLLQRSKGLPERFARAPFAADLAVDSAWAEWNACDRRFPPERKALCQLGSRSADPQFALWGDSHAVALAAGVDVGARALGASGVMLTANGCAPMLQVRREYPDGVVECEAEADRAMSYLAAHPRITTVVLAGRWSLYLVGRPPSELGDPVRLRDSTLATSNTTIATNGLVRTVARLRALGKRVVLVGPVPEIGADVPTVAQLTYLTGRDLEHVVAPRRTAFLERNSVALGVFDSLTRTGAVELIRPDDVLCDERCHVQLHGRLLYRDDDHLSALGSEQLATLFRVALERNLHGRDE